MTALWEQVEAGGRRAEQRHREVMKLYTEVLQGGGSGGGAWLTSMMEHQQQRFRALLDQKGRQVRLSLEIIIIIIVRAENIDQIFDLQAHQRQSRTSRVDRLESQLLALAARTEVRTDPLSGSFPGCSLSLTL